MSAKPRRRVFVAGCLWRLTLGCRHGLDGGHRLAVAFVSSSPLLPGAHPQPTHRFDFSFGSLDSSSTSSDERCAWCACFCQSATDSPVPVSAHHAPSPRRAVRLTKPRNRRRCEPLPPLCFRFVKAGHGVGPAPTWWLMPSQTVASSSAVLSSDSRTSRSRLWIWAMSSNSPASAPAQRRRPAARPASTARTCTRARVIAPLDGRNICAQTSRCRAQCKTDGQRMRHDERCACRRRFLRWKHRISARLLRRVFVDRRQSQEPRRFSAGRCVGKCDPNASGQRGPSSATRSRSACQYASRKLSTVSRIKNSSPAVHPIEPIGLPSQIFLQHLRRSQQRARSPSSR